MYFEVWVLRVGKGQGALSGRTPILEAAVGLLHGGRWDGKGADWLPRARMAPSKVWPMRHNPWPVIGHATV